jgi:hypothetical protein
MGSPDQIVCRGKPDKGSLYLVSCVGKKRAARAAAEDLYISDWFRLARSFVERTGSPWFILSAKYGLVGPREVVEPYELTLNTLGVSDRKKWAALVTSQMNDRLPMVDRVVVLAGERYREFLMDELRRRANVEVPLEGLRIGEQLHWLKERLKDG